MGSVGQEGMENTSKYEKTAHPASWKGLHFSQLVGIFQ
jgi:hypothetical protein